MIKARIITIVLLIAIPVYIGYRAYVTIENMQKEYKIEQNLQEVNLKY